MMINSSDIRERLYARLRQPPIALSVTQSLPVLFFGDLFAAGVATVGLNPSDKEYLGPGGVIKIRGRTLNRGSPAILMTLR